MIFIILTKKHIGMNAIKTLYFLVISAIFTACGGVTVKTTDNYEQVELPDNTVVYLNQNSSISYDEEFDSRHIKLTGEAFFSVTEGDSPFVIETDLGEVTVLGTEFNVNTTKEDIEIEVEQGNVELKSISNQLKKEIKQGEKAILKISDQVIKKGKAEFKHNAWINNLKAEFKKLGKELKKSGKKMEKQLKKEGKTVGKQSKKIGNEIKKESKKLKNKLN